MKLQKLRDYINEGKDILPEGTTLYIISHENKYERKLVKIESGCVRVINSLGGEELRNSNELYIEVK